MGRSGGERGGGQGDGAGVQGRRRPSQGHHRLQVDPVGHGRGQGGQRRPHLVRTLGHRHQPQVTVPPHQAVVPPEGAQDGDAQGQQRLPEEHLVAVGRDPVEHDAADAHRRVEGGEAVHHRRHRRRLGRSVHHQHDGGVEGPGHVGGRRRRSVGRPVEQSHDALDHQEVGPVRGSGRQRPDGVEAAQPGVEVAGRASTGEGVVPGIDEVGPHLGRRRTVPGRPQRGQQTGGHRGLAGPGMGPGHHHSGSDHRCSVASSATGTRCESGAVPPL